MTGGIVPLSSAFVTTMLVVLLLGGFIGNAVAYERRGYRINQVAALLSAVALFVLV